MPRWTPYPPTAATNCGNPAGSCTVLPSFLQHCQMFHSYQTPRVVQDHPVQQTASSIIQ